MMKYKQLLITRRVVSSLYESERIINNKAVCENKKNNNHLLFFRKDCI